MEVATGGSSLTRTQTLSAWRASRTLTQNGGTLDPLDPVVTTTPSGGRYDPINFEALHLGFSAVTTNFTDAMAEAIFEPFQDAFGEGRLCGEWDIYCASQEHQTPLLPTKRMHMLGGDLSINLQVPKNYGDMPLARYNNNPSLYSQALAWEAIWNWLQVYQPAGYTPWTTYPSGPFPELSGDLVQRVVLEAQTELVRACVRAAPNKAIMPSVSVAWRQLPSEPPYTQEQRSAAATPYMVRYMINCCLEGAEMFYLFAPGWSEGYAPEFNMEGVMILSAVPASLIRQSNYELIRQFNGEFEARIPYRNRMFRHSA